MKETYIYLVVKSTPTSINTPICAFNTLERVYRFLDILTEKVDEVIYKNDSINPRIIDVIETGMPTTYYVYKVIYRC